MLRNQLAGLGSLIYLGSDDSAGSRQWETERSPRLVYYKGAVGARTFYFTIGLNCAGKVGRLELQPNP